MNKNLVIAETTVKPGTHTVLQVPLPPLYTSDPLTMPVHVLHGKQEGPKLFISAAIHGDELNGVEIIRRLIKRIANRRIAGTLLAVPTVNSYGMIQRIRYLPDRRDLNRSFPGSINGSLASRLAYLFMHEIVEKCTHGIDLHTGALNRENLPQIRADMDDEETSILAKAFRVPVIINSRLRDGSLREAARKKNVRILLYEAGEAMRFNELCIRAGVNGILNVMKNLNMLTSRSKLQVKQATPYIAQSSEWIRAPISGIFRSKIQLGAQIKHGQNIGTIEDVCGVDAGIDVLSRDDGIVIGKSHIPLVYEGDPLFHIASFKNDDRVAESLEDLESQHASLLD